MRTPQDPRALLRGFCFRRDVRLAIGVSLPAAALIAANLTLCSPIARSPACSDHILTDIFNIVTGRAVNSPALRVEDLGRLIAAPLDLAVEAKAVVMGDAR
jgi:hypothetical protein